MLRSSLYWGKRPTISCNLFPKLRKQRDSRPFAKHTQLLLLPPVSPRPQLPFLHVPSHGSYSRNGRFRLYRLISTDTQRTIRDTATGGFKVFLVLIGATVCFFSVISGIIQFRLERIYPTPHEWPFFTRWAYREAIALEDDEGKGSPIDWPQVGPAWRACLARLEETGGADYKNLEPIETGLELKDIPVWDATQKSEQWKRGYFEVVMGCGRAAEHLAGWYQDTTRPTSRPVPADVIVGPSNLDPRPLPPEQGSPPREENCKPVMESPDTFYRRITDSKGFSRRQRLLATLALADYLDFQGNQADAEHYYGDGLVFACSLLPEPEKTVNTSTGVIQGKASVVSDNMLLASTALGVHYARTANTAAALPIFLSALRATQEGNSTPISAEPAPASLSSAPQKPPSTVDKIIEYLQERPYPPPLSSGDEPLRRSSETCSEPMLLVYIGEILFATSKTDKDRERGIAWTKEATDLADSRASQISKALAHEEQLGKPQQRFLAERNNSNVEACLQCLELGLTNLQKMVSRMVQREKEHDTTEWNKTKSWASWFGGSSESRESTNRWQKEQEDVATRLQKFGEERVQEMMAGQAGGKPVGMPRIH